MATPAVLVLIPLCIAFETASVPKIIFGFRRPRHRVYATVALVCALGGVGLLLIPFVADFQ